VIIFFMNGTKFIGMDLFAGGGGLSLGAEMAGVNVAVALEKDKHAAETYAVNHPNTPVITSDIQTIENINISASHAQKILFGGPPCKGFSASNQRTRNKENPSNWLLTEFIRIRDSWKPDWVVFENVSGFTSTENKLFLNCLMESFESNEYECTWYILNASEYGVPQRRARFFLIASKAGYSVLAPKPSEKEITVNDALSDLPSLSNGANTDYLKYEKKATSEYAKSLRYNLEGCTGHLVTHNADHIIERYTHISPGGNWENIPEHLMKNYKDRTRCHAGIYHRLDKDKSALTIGNYRKAMLIHPWENRGLSVREAARLQSFPDWYQFRGTLGAQQQQVGNAVPPLLAKEVFNIITNGDYNA
jgi:DNA (cytosine-5)-methyltransferase 1